MSNIQLFKRNLVSVQKRGLTRVFFEDISDEYNAIELSIQMNDKELNVKELSSYLDLIYRIDGQLSEYGYSRYVHNPSMQIEIDQIRFGSWIIVIERFLKSIEGEKLVILFLGLKYLPLVVKTIADSFERYYEIMNKREDYIEKKDSRRKRKEIDKLLANEDGFAKLDKKERKKLVLIIEGLFDNNKGKIVAASRFAQKSIKDIRIKPAKKNHLSQKS
jgi:hypothetical protein